ncbi:DUF4433 domain-containing protein [Acidovorax sp. Be4]|uniref:DUF4433 domain-containing protein n=1 Tax=Acidovorax bellezanensis TaxID=2976702 RepID=A0ABT2PH82_9BURK|nr:DUF4433 domain-containing protein [Acidovorax sp. Be4]MCT9809787.1 DUF4433 domain-containing protein [Acidovorax sp. Be4]
MPIPQPVRLFHITAIDNLPALCRAGALLSKTQGAAAGVAYQNIAHDGAQRARAAKLVALPPRGSVHDYVPFYFAPRSPMLSAIHHGRVVDCALQQQDIVHLETTVDRVTAGGTPFVFYDRNATLAYSRPYDDVEQLADAVAWDLITAPPALDGFCKYFHNQHQNERYVDRRERRMAEFLVHGRVPLGVLTRVGVCNAPQARAVQAILDAAGVPLQAEVKTDWYFLGQ